MIDTDDPTGVTTQVETRAVGEAVQVTATLRTTREVSLFAGARFRTRHAFGVGMFGGAVVQRAGDIQGWASSATALTRFYTMDRDLGSVVISPAEPTPAICAWQPDEGSAVTLIAAGTVDPEQLEGFVPGAWTTATERTLWPAGSSLRIVVQVDAGGSPAPVIDPEAVALPSDRDTLTHSLALWGSQVPSLGTLEVRGSAHPTVNLPRREYGWLHTFFDPDAWSVVASLSFSGIDELYAQARDVLERSLGRITADGLVPHHFDGEEPVFVAISGSPQPGPNIFLVEAAIDHACARGDFGWLASAWRRGLRAACAWLLARADRETGLLDVEGALWVDVFRRRGLTLDTNAMVVRTFSRAAELARFVNDDLAEPLRTASDSVRAGLQLLWSQDHFVTSRDPATGEIDDHLDAENYLAIAVGATSAEQARLILDRFDTSPLTHPGGRGTWVSLRRYDGADCHLHNTGDSDIAMARLWWADLHARRRLGDRARFVELFEAVRSDLLDQVWMRERYAAGGHPTRAHGYHEYPGILDLMLREGLCGISLDVLSAEIAPMREAPFSARFGEVGLDHAPDRVALRLPGDAPRRITVRGLIPGSRYRWESGVADADQHGVVTVEVLPQQGSVSLELVALGGS